MLLPRATGGGGGSTAPGGSDTQFQYNSAGAFAGIAGLVYNGAEIVGTIPLQVDGGTGTCYLASTMRVAIGDVNSSVNSVILEVIDDESAINLRPRSNGIIRLGHTDDASLEFKVDIPHNRIEFNQNFCLTDSSRYYVMRAPGGDYWGLGVDDSGNLVTTSLGSSLP